MSESKQSTREKAAAARAAAEASERRRERTVRLVLVLVVLVVVGGIIGAALWSTKKDEKPIDANAPLPAGISKEQLGAPVGAATKPVLDVYEDFQCPACANLEKVLGPTINQLANQGKVRVNLHPMTFLDSNLNNDASLRAAAAFGCAVDAGATAKYHSTVFANQPAQEGVGYTNDQLKAFGKEAGITGAAYDKFAGCVDAQTYQGWANLSQGEAETRGVTSTPSLYLNGQEIPRTELTTVDAFVKKIEAAAK
ncbi:MAG: hypothetical protein QG671_3091 [Actinomycetota bacterium]|jgi:protein-disulfide isomerase|nr:hypothetical protein [Actinomycetota bacterium]HQZ85498.1 thioredoxin domain-containing protein [Actinomycetota bacterium]